MLFSKKLMTDHRQSNCRTSNFYRVPAAFQPRLQEWIKKNTSLTFKLFDVAKNGLVIGRSSLSQIWEMGRLWFGVGHPVIGRCMWKCFRYWNPRCSPSVCVCVCEISLGALKCCVAWWAGQHLAMQHQPSVYERVCVNVASVHRHKKRYIMQVHLQFTN